MVRLVFRPLAHVRQAICTSALFRPSRKISNPFGLHTLRSPSFGSQQICSFSNLSQELDRTILPPITGLEPQTHKAPFTFIVHYSFPLEYSHICQTPWSVFLDGPVRSCMFSSWWSSSGNTQVTTGRLMQILEFHKPAAIITYTRQT